MYTNVSFKQGYVQKYEHVVANICSATKKV